MTTEVVVMNKSAIAMAADSAVTISGGDQIAPKIYNSVNKLFQLSKVAPVGVMIYGGAEIMGVPWETIIKTYRQKLGSVTFDSLEEYASHFLTHLESDANLFSDEMSVRYFETHIKGLLLHIFKPLISYLDSHSIAKMSDKEVQWELGRQLGMSLAQIQDFIKQHQQIPRADEDFYSELKEDIESSLSKILKALASESPLARIFHKRAPDLACPLPL
ncbi:hypothetical protein [Endozoicomonas sp. 4G]|uniref:hypothetical protein n=1 Tax=Endozoicomonas sp. 4G TaxID=2872754 RepID=UPI0020786C45|nr:hypothetical protein [Endozoicomonas sp. 4G]